MWRATPDKLSTTLSGVGRVDERPLARAQLDQAHVLQVKKRFAYRRAADAELAHQIALGGEPRTGGKFIVADPLLDTLGDIFIETAATNDAHTGIPVIPV